MKKVNFDTAGNIDQVISLLKEAFCVDGQIELDDPHIYKRKMGLVFKIKNKNHKEFYIGVWK